MLYRKTKTRPIFLPAPCCDASARTIIVLAEYPQEDLDRAAVSRDMMLKLCAEQSESDDGAAAGFCDRCT